MPVEVKLSVVQVELIAEIIQGLPLKVIRNSEHPVEFLIKNTHEADAVITNFHHGSLLEDSLLISEETIDGDAPVITYRFTEFKEKLAKGLKLDPHKQYRVKAIYKVTEENQQNNILFKYKESAT